MHVAGEADGSVGQRFSVMANQVSREAGPVGGLGSERQLAGGAHRKARADRGKAASEVFAVSQTSAKDAQVQAAQQKQHRYQPGNSGADENNLETF